MRRALARRLALIVALMAAATTGCGKSGAGSSCEDSTIESACAIATGPCRDRHGNTCIICAGAHVSDGCIYDPHAPLDGGTAVCVAHCAECGNDCVAQ